MSLIALQLTQQAATHARLLARENNRDPGVLVFPLSGRDTRQWTCTMISDTVCRVGWGYLLLYGFEAGLAKYSQSDVTCTGAGWIALVVPKVTGSGGVRYQANEPNYASATNWEFPIAKIAESGGIMSVDEQIADSMIVIAMGLVA